MGDDALWHVQNGGPVKNKVADSYWCINSALNPKLRGGTAFPMRLAPGELERTKKDDFPVRSPGRIKRDEKKRYPVGRVKILCM